MLRLLYLVLLMLQLLRLVMNVMLLRLMLLLLMVGLLQRLYVLLLRFFNFYLAISCSLFVFFVFNLYKEVKFKISSNLHKITRY